ncbi:MAG: DUF4013 domain-containing protein, partial [Methanobacterium sp.]|nr:DUF4013 domain-containing protein [Methanobacterium sp.]
MNLSEILSESFKYPLSNLKRMLMLGILLALNILIIPAILSMGYYIRIIESSFQGSNELPPFNEWGKMFTDGLKYIVVLLVYLGIPAFIGVIIVTLIIMFLAYSYVASMGIYAFMGITYSLLLLIMIVPYFVSFMGIARMVKENSVKASFEFTPVINVIQGFGAGRYIAAIIIFSLLSFLVVLISSIPQMITGNLIIIYGVSIGVALFINSYVNAFGGRLISQIYQEGLEEHQIT